jgi:hypothetical protein
MKFGMSLPRLKVSEAPAKANRSRSSSSFAWVKFFSDSLFVTSFMYPM